MSQTRLNVSEYVKTGEYFTDSRIWYSRRFVIPIVERSYLLIFTSLILSMLITLGIAIEKQFPLRQTLQFISIISDNIYDKQTTIVSASAVPRSPEQSIAYVLSKNYLINRERYDYDDLKRQMLFVKNTSTKLTFKRFSNLLSLDNPESPVLRYQKYAKRFVDVNKFRFDELGDLYITFTTTARDKEQTIFENITWEAKISYEMNKINLNQHAGSKFNYLVTDYKVKLLKNNM